MPARKVPSVFISSTCYDLHQIRADLRDFVKSIGLEPILSEFSSFPIDPSSGTVDNSVGVVDDNADIFVLVIGGRHGSQSEQGKSITNLEYLHAKAKGIPTYTFVLKSILDLLPVWKDNPEGRFDSVVDSTLLFEFVQSIRETGEEWVFNFEYAADIINALRTQLAVLFFEALSIRHRMTSSQLQNTIGQLRGGALSLAIEQPIAWPERLFSQILAEEIDSAGELKRDQEYGVSFEDAKRLHDKADLTDYVQSKMHSLIQVTSGLDRLINQALQKSLQEVGTTGDPRSLLYTARKVAAAYRQAVSWKTEFISIDADSRFERALRLVSEMNNNIVGEIEEFSTQLQMELEAGVEKVALGESAKIEITLVLTAPDPDPLVHEIESLH